jgi:hypothetical protein
MVSMVFLDSLVSMVSPVSLVSLVSMVSPVSQVSLVFFPYLHELPAHSKVVLIRLQEFPVCPDYFP